MDVLRNLARQKGRSLLTIGGVFVGILALTVLGAMVERINAMLTITEQFFATQIMVMPKSRGNSFGGGVFTEEHFDKISSIEGVEAVVPRINIMIDMGEGFAFTLGLPPMIQAVDLALDHNEWKNLKVRSGEMLTASHEKAAVLGSDLARQLEVQVGELVTLNGEDFEVAGILEKTLSGPDNMALLNISDGRRLLGFEDSKLATSAAVIWQSDVDPEELSRRIQDEMEGVLVMSPQAAKEILSQAMLVINLVILGAAGVALVVGGLAVINTMMMSISERTREIGVKMAVGARTRTIISEFLLESGTIGLIGGILGLGIGAVLVRLGNTWTSSRGVEIFYISPRLIFATLVFAAVIGILAGIYPAYRASQLNCVQALRRE